MKRTIYLIISLLLAMPLAGSKIQAQPFGLGQSPRFGNGDGFGMQEKRGRGRRPKRRSRRYVDFRKDRKNLSVAKMWMLTNELDLSEAQAAKLFPRMKDHQKALDGLSKEKVELFRAFRQKAEDEQASVKDIEKFTDELAKIEKKRIDLKARFIKGTKDILKPEQQAIFTIFEERSRGILRDRLIDSGVLLELHQFDRRDWVDDDD